LRAEKEKPHIKKGLGKIAGADVERGIRGGEKGSLPLSSIQESVEKPSRVGESRDLGVCATEGEFPEKKPKF